MTDTLIWAAVVLAPVMTAVLWLAPSCRRAITAWTDAHVATTAERDAAVQDRLAGIEEKRHALALRHATLAEDTAAERARLKAEEADFETEAEACRRTLDEAITARRKALAARADAEAELAPETARKALEGSDAESLAALGEAYAAFCARYGYADIPTFGKWIAGFEGLPRD